MTRRKCARQTVVGWVGENQMNVEQTQVAGGLWSWLGVSALVGLFAGIGLVFVVFGPGGLQLGGLLAVSILTVLWIVWLNQGLQRGVSRPGRLVLANTLGFAVGVTLGFALFIGFFRSRAAPTNN